MDLTRLKLRCQQAAFILEALEDHLFPCQLFEATCIPWLMAPPHILLISHCHHHISYHRLFPASSREDLCDDMGLILIIQDLPSLDAQLNPICKVLFALEDHMVTGCGGPCFTHLLGSCFTYLNFLSCHAGQARTVCTVLPLLLSTRLKVKSVLGVVLLH